MRPQGARGLARNIMESSISKRKEYRNLMLSEANEKGLEQLLITSWRAVLQIYFDKAVNAPATLAIRMVSYGNEEVGLRSQ